MAQLSPSTADRAVRATSPLSTSYEVDSRSAQASAVSWGAVFAGAAATAALGLILMILGVGLGLSSVSPWSDKGISATTFGVSTIVWLTVTQLLACGMGGYLAGRLRASWALAHGDEVHFRDTAHGFLAWAVSSLVTATLLASAIGSILGTTAQAGASVAGGVVSTATTATAAAAAGSSSSDSKEGQNMGAYFVDSLFRKDPNESAADTTSAAPTGEITRIFWNSLRTGELPADDVRYVAQVVAQRTGLSPQDAQKRVNDTYARMQTTVRDAETASREAADKARKASSSAALWLFVTLLIGAFVASFLATVGGRQRDA